MYLVGVNLSGKAECAVLITALFSDTIAHRIGAIKRAGRLLYKLAGAVMVLTGIAIMIGQLTHFAYWLLVAFSVLSKIG